MDTRNSYPQADRLTLIPHHSKSKVNRLDTSKNANRLIDTLTHEGTLIGFAGGSKKLVSGICRVGVGLSITWKGNRIESYSRVIGPRTDNYNAEMLVTATLAQRCVTIAKKHRIHKVYIFSDNQSAMETINSPKLRPAQHASLSFRESARSFLATDPSRTFIVQWIPGHSRIPGNERADQLTNVGTELEPTPLFDRTATSQKCNAIETAHTTWTQIWDTVKQSEHARRFIPNPPSLKLNAIFAKDPPARNITSRLVQIITRHGFFWRIPSSVFSRKRTYPAHAENPFNLCPTSCSIARSWRLRVTSSHESRRTSIRSLY